MHQISFFYDLHIKENAQTNLASCFWDAQVFFGDAKVVFWDAKVVFGMLKLLFSLPRKFGYKTPGPIPTYCLPSEALVDQAL